MSADNPAKLGLRLSGTFSYNERPLFSDLMLELLPGSWTCLLGSSGIGKSTLLRLLAGLETGGSFSGSISASDKLPLDGRVAYMAQSDLLLPWLTVQQNVSLGATLRKEPLNNEKIDHLIRKVGLEDYISNKPGELSGGMRQRCALARTLMENTPLVLLDEPFSALDPFTRRQMQALSYSTLKQRTVLLVTHDLAEALRLGARIYAMTQDKLEQFDLPACQSIRELDDPNMLDIQSRIFSILNA
ncbi:MAG: ABC transporter ATP-binding protein [Gammaproteobacteria bacterium]|nr:ABC transporter ATP-binding protein [Gammaproteobacteria bacterium]MCY4275442.1 ABC transporter ATP-binding protein [Gammaproteobacteria bacterium]